MPVQRSFPTHYADSNLTSTGLAAVGFGFQAGQVTVTNNGAGAAFVAFNSTSAATTNDFQVSSGESITLRGFGAQCSGFAWATTSTATVLRAGAWG